MASCQWRSTVMIRLIICLSFTAIVALTPAVSAGSGLAADFSGEGIVNYRDFAVLANAWLSIAAGPCWNPVCDISDPPDDIIDKFDLAEFAGYWLQLGWPYGPTTRVSVASDGQQGNDHSNFQKIPAISADGRYVAFESDANNLVDDDTNGYSDIFVHDRLTGQTTRVSVSSASQQGNGNSSGKADEPSSISADGRYVAFTSNASNLVEVDTNGKCDVFVRDRQKGETTRVSVSSTGQQGDGDSRRPAISADGRYVAFVSTAGNFGWWDPQYWDVFVHDRQTGETELVSVNTFGYPGNYPSESHPLGISADGRYVAFASWASDLVEGDTNDKYDVFVRDRQMDETIRVSVSSAGQQGNDHAGPGLWGESSISSDGRYVAFVSNASNLVEDDTNGYPDIFVHDCQTHQTTRVSVSSAGEQANRKSEYPSISADGRYVAFKSIADNLVEANTNGGVFVHDRQTGQTGIVSSVGLKGVGGYPRISANGRYVVFVTTSDKLVEDDTNGYQDVFVHDCFGY